MEKYTEINKLLVEQCDAIAEKILNCSYQVQNLTIAKLRDILIMMGRIHFEDLEKNIYIALIPGGIRKKNTAYVVFRLVDDELHIAAYSDEGLIKQNTSKGVIDEIGKIFDKYIK